MANCSVIPIIIIVIIIIVILYFIFQNNNSYGIESNLLNSNNTNNIPIANEIFQSYNHGYQPSKHNYFQSDYDNNNNIMTDNNYSDSNNFLNDHTYDSWYNSLYPQINYSEKYY